MKILRAIIDELLLMALTAFCALMVAIGFLCGCVVWLFNMPTRLIERIRAVL